jgi:hypothetical protein
MKEFIHNIGASVFNFDTWSKLIIDINELMTILKYKDVRSVIKWCNDHDVFILSQGNTQVVNQVEFILAFYRPFIEHLKQTQENWKERFQDYIKGNLINLIDGEESTKPPPSNYRPQSALEQSFLQKMKSL